MAGTSGLPDRDILMLEVTDLSDRRVAAGMHLPHLTGGETQGRPFTFASHQLGERAGRTGHLAALPFLQLDVVHRRAEGDFGQGQSISHENVGFRT